MNTNSPEKILALLAEMARCLNQNMAKVKLTPIDPAFSLGLSALSVTPSSAIFPKLKRSSREAETPSRCVTDLDWLAIDCGQPSRGQRSE